MMLRVCAGLAVLVVVAVVEREKGEAAALNISRCVLCLCPSHSHIYLKWVVAAHIYPTATHIVVLAGIGLGKKKQFLPSSNSPPLSLCPIPSE